MRLLTFDELSQELDAQRTYLHLAAFGGVFSSSQVRLLRRSTDGLAEYVGLFAVERSRLLGQVFVLRVPYAFPDGPGVLGGIAGVATRPDHGRRGVARALLSEVHRRERESGVTHTALWTNRSWGAHALYEELGYRDVYFPPWAIAREPLAPPRAVPGVRRGSRSDLAEIERLHAELGRGRLGFHRRVDGFARAEVRLGNLDPAEALLVARTSGRLTGYAHVDRNPNRTVCGELLATTSRGRAALLAAVRRRAGAGTCAFQHSFVVEHPELFGRDRFVLGPTTWYGLLGCRLGRELSVRDAVREFGTGDRRFRCLAGDRF